VPKFLQGDLSFIDLKTDDVFTASMRDGADCLQLSVKLGLAVLLQISGRNGGFVTTDTMLFVGTRWLGA
jgi:hypothetical protein